MHAWNDEFPILDMTESGYSKNEAHVGPVEHSLPVGERIWNRRPRAVWKREGVMITLRDCYGLSDGVPEEVVAVACHEKLPPILAAGKTHDLLTRPWGGPAMRQMILDEYNRAGALGDRPRAAELAALYVEARQLHPGGEDRRHKRRVCGETVGT